VVILLSPIEDSGVMQERALAEPAAEPRIVQSDIVAQRVEQRHIGIVDGDRARLAVHVKREALRHGVLPESERR